MQSNIQSSTFFQKAKCLLPGQLYYIPDYLTASKSLKLYDRCKNEVLWQQTWINFYGLSHKVPRLVSWSGEKGINYSYSGQDFCADGWPPFLEEAKLEIEELLKTPFNSVLSNYYPEGKHHMGWHSDNEPELGEVPVIASLSLGTTRRFLYRQNPNPKGAPSEKLDLTNGSLLVMCGGFQKNWQHRISPTRKCVEGRINLTFRYIFKRL